MQNKSHVKSLVHLLYARECLSRISWESAELLTQLDHSLSNVEPRYKESVH